MSSELNCASAIDLPKLPAFWSWSLLRDLVDTERGICYGIVQPGKHDPNGVPMVNTGDVFDGGVAPQVLFRVSKKLHGQFKRSTLRGGELLVTLVGANFGRVAIAPENYAGNNCSRAVGVVPLTKDAEYVMFALRSPLARHLMNMWANTTAQPTFNLKDLGNLPVPIPPTAVKNEITKVLKGLDDRIRLLRETNATLEAIAQALFKSWFVDFDPVQAKMEGRSPEGMDESTAALFPDSFEESELGLVPRGWRVGVLGDVLALRNERTKPSVGTQALPYVPIESISAKVPFLQEYKSGEEANSSLILFRKGDILFGAMRPYFHKVCAAPFDGVTRTTVFTLQAKNPMAVGYALFLAFQESTIEYATQHSEGSTIPYAKWGKSLEYMPIILPPDSIQIAFGEIVSSFIERANKNIEQVQTLATLRDTLLPRLISGQLRLPGAEAEIEEVTA